VDRWLLPDEPVAVRLMNTVWADRDGAHDALQDVGDLMSWLAAAGFDGPTRRARRDDVRVARRLRDACRRVAAHVTADPRPRAASATADLATAVADLNAIATAVRPVGDLVLRGGELQRAAIPPRASLAAALATVAADAIDLVTNPERPPLRACLAPGCVLYFVRDHPRREWCSAACGNRARAARHYRRHH
jgi:predicted RNA-binding Zn ribbon-like protein